MHANMQLIINSFRPLFPDKIFSLTIPWLFVKSLTFPRQLSNFLTFPGFPYTWSPCKSNWQLSRMVKFDTIHTTQSIKSVSHADDRSHQQCLEITNLPTVCSTVHRPASTMPITKPFHSQPRDNPRFYIALASQARWTRHWNKCYGQVSLLIYWEWKG